MDGESFYSINPAVLLDKSQWSYQVINTAEILSISQNCIDIIHSSFYSRNLNFLRFFLSLMFERISWSFDRAS